MRTAFAAAISIMAAIGFGASCAEAQNSAPNVEDFGATLASINADITSVSVVLGNRPCLTRDERFRLFSYLGTLKNQLFDLSSRAQTARDEKFGMTQADFEDLYKQDEYSSSVADGLRRNVLAKPICTDTNVAQIGFYIGGHFIKLSGNLESIEKLAETGQTTNNFKDSKDPFGGGLLVGAKFMPFGNSVVVSPFASFDFFNASVNHTFPGGSFLGTTENFAATFGVKVGPRLDMGLWLYGIAGVGVMNETLRVNFIPVSSSQSATVPGGTVGLGAAWQLPGVSFPVSLFAEYQHTWWQEATFNQPAASPFFNYTFRRQDDLVKVGFTIPIGPQPVPALPPLPAGAPSYPVKAKAK